MTTPTDTAVETRDVADQQVDVDQVWRTRSGANAGARVLITVVSEDGTKVFADPLDGVGRPRWLSIDQLTRRFRRVVRAPRQSDVCKRCNGWTIEKPAGPPGLTTRPDPIKCLRCKGSGIDPDSHRIERPDPATQTEREDLLGELATIGGQLRELSQRRRPEYVAEREDLYARVRELTQTGLQKRITADDMAAALSMTRQGLHKIRHPELYRAPR